MLISSVWILPTGFIVGLIINYLTDILPFEIRSTHPVCSNPDCRQPMSWLRYFLLQRCKICNKKQSIRHFIVYIISILMLYYIYGNSSLPLGVFGSYLLFQYLFLVAIIDFEHRLILRPLSIAGLILGLIVGILTRSWQSTLIGAGVGFGIMLLFYYLGILFSKFRNKRLGNSNDSEESLGSGDVTLAAILGLILGWPLIWFNLFSGIILAGIFSILLIVYLILAKKYRSMMVYIAYGPFFIASAIFMIFFPGLVSSFLPGL
jgi:prepilin signal peptidase PulO-like enzyme (type II secretory pathway)